MSRTVYMGEYALQGDFTNENAGTSEWCRAERAGKTYFIKKMLKPVYPSADLELPENVVEKRKKRFHKEMNRIDAMYRALRDNNTSGALVVPVEVRSYQLHICTVAEYIQGNFSPGDVHRLPERTRVVLMRTLALALMNVHDAQYIHADIKPDNVLIIHNAHKGSYFLKLIDFDSSYPMSAPPEDMETMRGDIAYWAPEIYRKVRDAGIRLDHRIDLFALGVLFHYLWCGKLPKKPDDKTLGQHLAEGGKITLEETLPLVIRRLIGGLLEEDPAKRLTCRNAYDVLGVQLKKYPEEKKVVAGTSKAAPPVKKTEPAGEKGKVTIRCQTVGGKHISTRQLEVLAGSEIVANAPEIAGYKLMDTANRVVRVDEKGNASPSPVVFEYAKKGNAFASCLKWAASLFALYLVVVLMAVSSAISDGNWADAKEYADMFPFYPQIFTNQYEQIIRNGGGTSGSIPAMPLNTAMSISIPAGGCKVLSFTAPQSGNYRFYSSGEVDVKAWLYNNAACTGSYLAMNDDMNGSDRDFFISSNLAKGQTVYLKVSMFSSGVSGTTNVYVAN